MLPSKLFPLRHFPRSVTRLAGINPSKNSTDFNYDDSAVTLMRDFNDNKLPDMDSFLDNVQ